VYPRLGCGAKVTFTPVCYWHIAYTGQRLQRSTGQRWAKEVYDRESWRGRAIAEITYMLQPIGSASIQNLRSTQPEIDDCGGGDRWIRTRVVVIIKTYLSRVDVSGCESSRFSSLAGSAFALSVSQTFVNLLVLAAGEGRRRMRFVSSSTHRSFNMSSQACNACR